MKHPRPTASPSGTRAATARTREERKRAPGALFRLDVHVAPDVADAVAACLIEEGAGGVEEQPLSRSVRLVTYDADPAVLERIEHGVTVRLAEAGVRHRTGVRAAAARIRGWDTAWMRHLEPVQISRSLVIAPTNTEVAKAAATVVRLEPAKAFGFGEHPTTRMAARAIERACRGGVRSMFDLGTGSGVLAIVAAVAGATRVVGTDIDDAAVAAATHNATLNAVGARCRFAATPVRRIRGRFELVVANVDLRTLEELGPELARVTSPSGTLLVTGFLSEHAADVQRRYRALGMTRTRRATEGEWALLSFSASSEVAPQSRRVRPATARGKSRTRKSR